jgi:hypothetical protein
MKPIRFLAGAVMALALLPASALAQTPEPPGSGDNYLQPIVVSNSANPQPFPGVLGFDVDTTNYTLENSPTFGGVEFNQCGTSIYGKTVWSIIYTNRYGRIDITAAGYDSVIGLASFKDPNNPTPAGGPCTDRLSGKIESFARDNLPTVKKNHWYAIQVGGFQNQDGSINGGALEVNVELLPPNAVIGDAGLSWVSTNGGIKVKSVRIDGPKGSVITVACTKKKCGKNQSFQVSKATPLIKQPVLKANPLARFKTMKKLEPTAPDRTVVHAAASKNVFKGRTIKNGTRLIVAVEAKDQIGELFYWDIKKNAAGTKAIGCIEPGSTKVQALGSCDGK